MTTGWGRGVGGRAVRVWAVAMALVFAAVGALRADKEALAFAGLTLVATALTLVRKGLVGRLFLAALATATLAFLVPAAISNLTGGEQFADVAVPAVLSALAVAVLALVLGVPPAPVLVVGGLLIVAGIGAGFAAASGDDVVADRRIETKNVAFSPETLTVRSGGVVAVTNRDLFWHTFTVDDLDVDLRVPTGATRTVTIDAEPGDYTFVCAVPGHEDAGMEGTLTVL